MIVNSKKISLKLAHVILANNKIRPNNNVPYINRLLQNNNTKRRSSHRKQKKKIILTISETSVSK